MGGPPKLEGWVIDTWTLQCSSFFGFGMDFWLGFLLGQKGTTLEGLGKAYVLRTRVLVRALGLSLGSGW